jgi:K+-transporting ATPase ATPase B chain
MFVVEAVSVITSLISVGNLISGGPFRFNLQISLWLWFTVLFATFAEALAEGRGKAQAETLRKAQT